MTILAPAARHFLVQASALSLAPLAPHLSSLTQPLTVALLPMSSNASADTASTKNNARQTSRTFFITCILLFCSRCGPTPQVMTGVFLAAYLPATRSSGRRTRSRNPSGITHPRPNVKRGQKTIPQENREFVREGTTGGVRFRLRRQPRRWRHPERSRFSGGERDLALDRHCC